MTKSKICLLGAALVLPLIAPPRDLRAANPPSTSEVLEKLHGANQTEIAMGKAAEKEGHSKEVKSLGKTLVKDHSAADKKTEALAKEEKISLPNPEMGMAPPAAGPDFDMQFAKMMVDAHKKDIAALTDARDRTSDEKLKKLLTDLLPTLQRHEETAQKILDSSEKKHA